MHAHLLFLRLHFESSSNRFGGLIDVVRVYQQCVTQLASRTSELAKDQDTQLLAPCRWALFRHKVHAIVQGSHQAESSRTLIRFDLVVTVLTLTKHNRLPSSALEAPT